MSMTRAADARSQAVSPVLIFSIPGDCRAEEGASVASERAYGCGSVVVRATPFGHPIRTKNQFLSRSLADMLTGTPIGGELTYDADDRAPGHRSTARTASIREGRHQDGEGGRCPDRRPPLRRPARNMAALLDPGGGAVRGSLQ